MSKFSYEYKPIGASPGRDYVVLTRMEINNLVLYMVRNDTSKKGGALRGLQIKREREGML